jgi:hypothetical protein
MATRLRAMACILLPMMLVPASPIWANDGIDLDTGGPDHAGEVDTEVSLGGEQDRLPAVTPINSGNGNGDPWVGLPIARHPTDGEDACIDYRWVQLPAGEIEQAERNAWEAINFIYSNIPELQGMRPTEDCPVEPTEDLPPPLVREAVRQTVIDVLPRPEPRVPPGYALTGMPAYLVTDHALDYGPVDHPVDLGIMELTVQVTGTGTSTVDWGDGSEPQTYDQPGLPYPDGNVKYTYADRGDVAITVTDSWRLTFDVYRGGDVIISDVVEFELAPVTLEEPLEIRELRSVRTSSR